MWTITDFNLAGFAKRAISVVYRKVVLLDPILAPILRGLHENPAEKEHFEEAPHEGTQEHREPEAEGSGGRRDVPKGGLRKRAAKPQGGSRRQRQEEAILPTHVRARENTDAAWTNYLHGLCGQFKLYNWVAAATLSYASYLTHIGASKSWLVLFLARIAWLLAATTNGMTFFMWMYLRCLKERQVSEVRCSWSQRSATNKGSTYLNTSRLLQVPAAGIVQSMALTALAAITIAAYSPTLEIAPFPLGTSAGTAEFPPWVRAVFAITAGVRVIYCAVVFYAFVQLGLPSTGRGGGLV